MWPELIVMLLPRLATSIVMETAPQEPGVDVEEVSAVIMLVAILQTAKSVVISTCYMSKGITLSKAFIINFVSMSMLLLVSSKHEPT